MPENLPDWENLFPIEPVHNFEKGDRVRLSEEYVKNSSSRDPNVLGTVATGAFEFLIYVNWDDGAFDAMYYSSLVKIS